MLKSFEYDIVGILGDIYWCTFDKKWKQITSN